MNENNITTLNFWFHLTDNCNLNCDYCYISTLETKKNMSRLVIFQFINRNTYNVSINSKCNN